jgi:2-isopropylmalate synthase
MPEATVKIKHKKKIHEAKSSGDGPVDACYKAIDKITKVKTRLITYGLEAITKGRDAQGLARVELQVKGKYVHGKGASTDILEASAKAYLDALNRLG